MAALDVYEFDGEDIGRALQFFACDDQRRGMLLLCPGIDRGCEGQQLWERRVLQDTQQVHVGVLRMVFTRRCRSVEDHALEIRPCSLLQAGNEVVDLLFRNQIFRSHRVPRANLPASTSAAATRTTTAESSETTSAATESSTTPPGAATPARSTTPAAAAPSSK